MMLKLSNISYERESGKLNFKVFLTDDVSISEVHLRQQARRRRRDTCSKNACESNSWRDQGGRVAVAFRLRLRQVGFF